MAEVHLQTLSIPGLPNTYVIPKTDTTLTINGAAAESASVGNALAGKVSCTDAQELTPEQKLQARENIGAIDEDTVNAKINALLEGILGGAW